MLRNNKKRQIRRKVFNTLIKIKNKYLSGLFDMDKNGYFVK